jgi:hypothetical protein
MTEKDETREKLRRIVGLLPRLNCGQCGFDNCGRFAVAVTEGRASPFGCQQNPSAGYQILKILGRQVPERAAAGTRRFTTARPPVPAAYPSGPRFGIAIPPVWSPAPEWCGRRGTGPHRGRGMRWPGARHGCRRRWGW